MNRFHFILLFFVLLLGATRLDASVTVKGKITNPKGNKVYVRYYTQYLTYETGTADSAELDKDGNFSMTFEWPASYPAQFQHGDEVSNLFLSPGYNLTLMLDNNKFDETIKYTGKGAEVNNYLAQKTRLSPRLSAMVIYKMPGKEFNHLMDSVYRSEMAYFTKWFAKADKKDTALTAFINYERAELTYTWALQKKYYPSSFTYFTKQQPELPSGFDAFLKEAPVQNASAVSSPAYKRYLQNHVEGEVQKKLTPETNEAEVTLALVDEKYSGILREDLYVQYIRSLLEKGDMNAGRAVFERYKTFAKHEPYVTVLNAFFAATERLMPGKPAPDFEAVDLDNKKVRLSDYKGKLVYVDVWASWCGPCVREIPYAEKLQEEFKGKDIVFLCVSVDENETSWRNIIRQKNIGGTHVRSFDVVDNVSTLYNINGIPHYFIVGKDGKIIDSNAKRPSQDAKSDLEKLLK